VLVREVVSLLRPRADGLYVDCTVGLGGHATALVAAGAGRVIGIDRDEQALSLARTRLGDAGGRVTLVHADYRDLPAVLDSLGETGMDGAVVDLGVSSMQLDDPARGFSFRYAGPLDMRMDRSTGQPLADRLADVDATTLADVIWRYGEERHSRRIARAILAAWARGELSDTVVLASVVRRAAGGGRWQRLDPATRTFQALRIWVNDELDRVDGFVEAAIGRLRQGGRLAAIAFHSLEDRVIKHTFRRLAGASPACAVVTKRAVRPEPAELERNPRARSARLRAVERVA
jgi:16S rRNA (cytosine1402-N4)-methyltransferase